MGYMTYALMRRREAARKAKEAGEHEQPEAGSAGGGQEGGTGGAGSEGGANGAGDGQNAGNGQAGAGNDAGNGGAGGQSPGNEAGQGNVPNSPTVTPDKLTAEQYAEVMRNKGNVMAELKRLGVEFSDRAGADDLRDVLNKELAAKGLLPDGN